MTLGRSLLGYGDLETVPDYLGRVADTIRPPEALPEAILVSPFELAAALDYLNTVWQLYFRDEPPLVRYFNAERIARLSYGVNGMDEFGSQISTVAEVLKNLQVRGGGNGGPLIARLRVKLCAELPEEAHDRLAGAVEVLADVAMVRTSCSNTVAPNTRVSKRLVGWASPTL